MRADLLALVARAPGVPAADRNRLAESADSSRPRGSVTVVTCHRVEIYGRRDELSDGFEREFVSAGGLAFDGPDVARHLIRLAVGTDSAIVAEDQLLHQLRTSLHDARAVADLPPELDRLFDLALRAGRIARSWLPAKRPNLAGIAIDSVVSAQGATPGSVLVVGAGHIGRLAAASLRERGAQLNVTSRTPERARAIAGIFGATPAPFDPPPALISRLDGIVVALGGPWPLSAEARAGLLGSRCWVIDLSSPPALDDRLRDALGVRLMSIDDLAGDAGSLPSTELRARLDNLADRTLAEYLEWTAAATQRHAAEALRSRASDVASAELERLWNRVPELSEAEREEIERALRRVTDSLLRDPLERLAEDSEGRHVRAAQQLFRL